MQYKKLIVSTLIKKLYKRLFDNRSVLEFSPKSTQKKILQNVFNSKYSKKALLSYIRGVFDDDVIKNDLSHTNRKTTIILAELLHQFGYQVDVINYDEEITDSNLNYEIVLGLGQSLEFILSNKQKFIKTKVIWFGTGCNPLFSNKITLERMVDFYLRHHKILLASTRYIVQDWPLQHQVSDAIILHGQSFAKHTYSHSNIHCIHAPVYTFFQPNFELKNWIETKKNFLWFGSGGLIHKGLDLVLDAFKNKSQAHLHICGNLEAETGFFEVYKNQIVEQANISYHGFVQINSSKFSNILNSCAFVLFPSASEANCAGVVTCMVNGGLIPIVNANTDVETDYKLNVQHLTVESVSNAIEEALNLDTIEVKRRSSKVYESVKNVHTFENFKEEMNQIFKKLNV